MSASTVCRWLIRAILTSLCLTVLGYILAAGSTRGLSRALTWILSSEMLGPGLVSGLAIAVYLLHKSHHTWRNM